MDTQLTSRVRDSKQVVLAACAFETPSRIPRIEHFWDLGPEWRERLGDYDEISDVLIRDPDETFFPSRTRIIEEKGGYIHRLDGWGRLTRTRPGSYFSETIDVALPAGKDPDSLRFDPPDLDIRFCIEGLPPAESLRKIEEEKTRFCVFGKTGGPFLRSAFLRGEEQFLVDIARDPSLASAIAKRVADHLTAVGVEEIRRWNLHETGIWIYDDIGTSQGPIVSPRSFERIFLPLYRRMIEAYRRAGARYVFLHSDGNVLPLLDMFVDAGIDGLNPVERHSGMDPAVIRARYPRLVLAGGVDNIGTLHDGPVEKIVEETRALIEMGRSGGVIIGAHSIGPDIPLEHYLAYHDTILKYGRFR